MFCPPSGKLNRRSPSGHGSDRQLNRILLADPISNLKFLIDTGADVSVLPKRYARCHKPSEDLVLFAANGTKIPTFGTKHLKIDLNLRRSFSWQFVVADVNQPIIGIDFLKKFNLLIDVKNNCLIDSLTKLSSCGKLPSQKLT